MFSVDKEKSHILRSLRGGRKERVGEFRGNEIRETDRVLIARSRAICIYLSTVSTRHLRSLCIAKFRKKGAIKWNLIKRQEVISYRSGFVSTHETFLTCERDRIVDRVDISIVFDWIMGQLSETRRGIISRCRLEIAIMVTSIRLEPYSCIRLVLPLFTHMLIPTGACSWTSACFVKR